MSSDSELGNGKTCFVVGPIGSRLDPRGTDGRLRYEEALQMWENVFEPACDQFDLRPIRADKIADPGEIPEQIFLHLRDSDLVIADVTGGNANVMYELGLRHTRDRMTIQLGEYGRLPFDINTIRTIQFRRSEGGLVEARDALTEAIRLSLSGQGRPVTATRLWNELATADLAAVTAAVERSTQVDSLDVDSPDEPGFMDILADGEAALTEVAEILGRASDAMAQTGSLSEEAGAEIAQSDAQGLGFAGRLQIARRLAANLQAPADSLNSAAADFFDRVARMDVMMKYMISHWEEDPADLEDSRGFGYGFLSLLDSTADSEQGVRAMIQGVRTLKKIARDLASVGSSIEVSMNKILQGMAVMMTWRDPLTLLFTRPVEGAADQAQPE
jgi:hypothetical protein